MTSGFVGRDLARLCRTAILHAMRREWDQLDKSTMHSVDAVVKEMERVSLVDGNTHARDK
jgi:hypothetical protein